MSIAVTPHSRLAGLLLAAGAGRRMGGPKALIRAADGVGWLERGVHRLLEAGCDPVIVVLGAAADEAITLLPADDRVVPVIAEDWRLGMGASLAAGMRAVAALHTDRNDGALITLVDLPDLSLEAMLRIADGHGAASLRQAVYAGRPGHPVLVGRDHWPAFEAGLHGDAGGRAYLVEHGVDEIDCSDLGSGRDQDSPDPP